MTVLFLADTRFPIERANGVQTMETCHALARLGHQIVLVVRPDSIVPPRDPFDFYGLTRVQELEVRSVPATGSARARRLRFLLTSLRLAAADRQAVVFTRDLGVAAWLLRLPRLQRPTVVYESHGIAPVVSEEMPRLLGRPELAPSPAKIARLDRRERRVWERASAYVAITRTLADELQARYGPRPRTFVVPDGARPAVSLPPAPGTPFTAAYAGHLYPWKGADVFVRAIARVPQVHGLIVGGHPGEADLARITGLAASLGVQGRLTITGLKAPGEVRAALAPASALVLPNTRTAISERYTSPLKLFEYLSLGRPIVASDLPAIREVLADGQNALLVPPDDDAAVAAAIVRLQGDPDLAGRLAAGARETSPRFTWDARARLLQDVLVEARSA